MSYIEHVTSLTRIELCTCSDYREDNRHSNNVSDIWMYRLIRSTSIVYKANVHFLSSWVVMVFIHAGSEGQQLFVDNLLHDCTLLFLVNTCQSL